MHLRLDYCAAFIGWLHREAGEPLPGNFWKNRACSRLQRELEDADWLVTARWKPDSPPLQPGDIVFFERKIDVPDKDHLIPVGAPGHVGLLVHLRRGGFQSVEGNIGGEVKLMTRILPHRNFLAAYRRPRS
ncbi:MAG: CHAP domain-containing protein [Acidobacteria bacterium]|nr:CHAP domain-containing protein [Acidobacteriota bacterium]